MLYTLFSLVVETRSSMPLSHDHTCRVLPSKQVSDPIRLDVRLEVLVHQLNGFFVSVTRHNTIRLSSTMLLLPALLPWIDIAPLPCLPCFCTVLHVLNCVRATHGLPGDRAPVYCGCPYRDPLGCPLIPRQNGIKDKAPTLGLLLCCCNC